MKPLALLLSLLVAVPASATEWHVLGARAMGMGGAGVAIAQGGVGGYWNPAGLGQRENPSGLQVPFSLGASITGPLLEGANDLNKLASDCQVVPTPANCTQANIDSALSKINSPESGVRADVGVGSSLKLKRLNLFVNGFAYVGGKPVAQIGVNNTPGTVINNTSKVDLRGIRVIEIGAGYGRELPFIPGLLVGANLKGMIGKVGYQTIRFTSTDPEGGSLSKFDDTSKSSFQPGIDVGALWDIDQTFGDVPLRPRVGVTARNINNPKFDQPDQAKAAGEPSKYSLQGQMRAGAAISPLRFWNIAADLDLTRNLTPLEGIASQEFGLGTEINVVNKPWFNLPLRAGLRRNLAEKSAKTAITGGFGLNFLHVIVDIGASVSPSTQKIQTQGEEKKVPASIGLAAQVAIMFGGGAEDKPKKR